jgi:hypothetical protein
MPHRHNHDKTRRNVRIKFLRPPTQVNGIHHSPNHGESWMKLPFLDGQWSAEFPDKILLPSVAALRQMIKTKGEGVARYWDEFDHKRPWRDDRLDGTFAFPIHDGVLRIYEHD